MTKAKPHEVVAWLGDNHGLTAEQVAELVRVCDELAERYPKPGDKEVREVARSVVLEALRAVNPETAVAEGGESLVWARKGVREALVSLEALALLLVVPPSEENPKPTGVQSQRGFADRAGVDRMTVLKWLGLR